MHSDPQRYHLLEDPGATQDFMLCSVDWFLQSNTAYWTWRALFFQDQFWKYVFHFRDCGNLQAPFNELMFCHNKWNLSDPFRKDEALLGRLKTDSSSSSSSEKNHFLQKSRLVIPLPLQRFCKKFMRLENPIILVSKDRCKICIWLSTDI